MLPFHPSHPFYDEDSTTTGRVCGRIYLVRHGETDANRENTAHKTVNARLTARGEQQALDVAKYFEPVSSEISTVTTSPFYRAQQTALPMAQKARICFPLREIWEHPNCEIEYHSTHMSQPCLRTVAPTETKEEFAARVKNVVANWARAKWYHTEVVFTHSLFISEVLWPMSDPSKMFHISNGSITIIDFNTEGNMNVHCVNSTAHLTETSGLHYPTVPVVGV